MNDSSNNNNNNNNVSHDEEVTDSPVDNPMIGVEDAEPALSRAQVVKRSLFRYCDKWTFLPVILLLLGFGGLAYVLPPYFRASINSAPVNKENDPEYQAELLRIRQANDVYYRSLRSAVISKVYGRYDPFIFLKPNSPQLLAMQWMSYYDTLHLPLGDNGTTMTDDDDEKLFEEQEGESFRWIQRFALMTIYFDNNGPAWSLFGDVNETTTSSSTTASTIITTTNTTAAPAGWHTHVGVPECQWELITCDDNDHITGLSLGGGSVKLSGMLTKEIGLLSSLRLLDLSQNQLQGSLPTELYKLTHLETLDVSYNEFYSSLDPRVDRLRKLKVLNLQDNLFSGELPITIELNTNLEELLMARNLELGGPVFSYAAHWPHLQRLDLTSTNSSGTIPTEVGLLTDLTELGLWDVPLSGTIPSQVGLLSHMRDVSIGEPYLTGRMPTEIGMLTSMENFNILSTDITGILPTEIGLWTNCESFAVVQSPFYGTLPTEIGMMESLTSLQFISTKLTGSIPTELGLLTNANDIMLHLNKLRGTMPEQICELDLKDLVADCAPPSDNLPAAVECDRGTCCTDCFYF